MKVPGSQQVGKIITGVVLSVLVHVPNLWAENTGPESLADAVVDMDVLLGVPVKDIELEQMRGGFYSADGLEFAFSFESITRVNGDVLSQASVVVPVLSLIGNQTGTLGVDQVLSSNMQNALAGDSIVQASQLGLIFEPVVLQNSFNDQVIETVNVLNLEVFGTSNLNATSVRAAILPTLVSALKQ